MSQISLEDLKHNFEIQDEDGDGHLSYAELRDVLLKGKNEYGLSEKQIRLLWRQIDQDHDERVDFDELADWLFGKKLRTPKEKWQDTFFAFAGVDDEMRLDEFKNLCAGVGLYDDAFTEADAEDVFKRICGDRTVLSPKCFGKAVARIAKKKQVKKKEVHQLILKSEGPSVGIISYEETLEKGDRREGLIK
eukprot:TRINITY_DN53256_c0_g1_i1.p1 TRINITY_DN53256_c0_g1~~TRINITY_DN53256_c0_g1_i1.p1  ORF type:complete len:191 (+),score=46.25 TRINITY_DN53256_c0_g1_i1:96-668(+)